MRLIRLAELVLFFAVAFQLRALEAERLFYLSGGEVCVGCVYKPKGEGPFRAVIFNQNVVKPLPAEGRLDPFPELAEFYTSHEFVLFSPGRRNVKSEGEDLPKKERKKPDIEEKFFQGHRVQCETIYSAIETLKAQSYVDPNHIYVTGFGFGAADTLLLGEKEIDVRGLVAFSPAGTENLVFLNAIRRTVVNTKTPVFLIQTRNDESFEAYEPVVQALKEKGPPNRSKIYSSRTGNNNSIAIHGTEIWGDDVLQFFKNVSK